MSLPSNRFQAVDVLRGLTLALMIVVNMSISDTLSFSQLLHSTWNGFTLTDAVFPTFLFVMGNALGFTLERYETQGRTVLLRKVAVRTGIMFLCGLVVSNFPFFTFQDGAVHWESLSQLRIMGVLQRISLAYALATLIVHVSGIRGAVIYIAAALIGNVWLNAAFGDNTLAGNAALKLDTFVLGASHLYRGEGMPYDPEGLLGTFPAVVNVLAGYLAVRYVRERPEGRTPLPFLFSAGLVLIVLSLALNGWVPINKKLWTSTYVLCTTGLDLVVLSALILLVDVWKVRWLPAYFEIFGKNALAIYILAELLMALAWTIQVGAHPLFLWIFEAGFHWLPGKWASLLFALAFAQICWLVAFIMDRKRIYVRI
jgi:predicted acyltransferase